MVGFYGVPMFSVVRVFVVISFTAGFGMTSYAQAVKLGAGNYFATPKSGDRVVPKAAMRTPAALPVSVTSLE